MEEEITSLSGLKLSETGLSDISTLKDRPNEPKDYGGDGLSAQQLKERFDNIPKAVLRRFNELLAFLTTKDYSEEIKIPCNNYATLGSLVGAIYGGGFSNILHINLDKEEYAEKVTDRNLTARIKYFLSAINTINVETIPNAKETAKIEAVGAANQHTDNTVSDLIGGELPEGYETLTKIANGVTELFDRIDALIGEGKLSEAFDTLVEVDEYLTNHKSAYQGILDDISDLEGSVKTLAGNVDTNKGKIETLESKVNTVINTTIPTAKNEAIATANAHTNTEVSELNGVVSYIGMSLEDYKIEVNEKLESIKGGDTIYVEDSEEKHIKIIPSGAYPYAFVNKIGGKTEKVTREGENIAELSAYDNVTLSNGEFSLTIPPDSSDVSFNGVGLSANLNPYIRYAINKHNTTMPSGCSVRFEYYLVGKDANGNFKSSNIGSPNSVLPCELGFAEIEKVSIDFSYYTNTTSAAKTVKFKLSIEPMFEYLISAPVTSVISQGRNLADDEGFYISRGMQKQTDGYWKGEQAYNNPITGTLFENIHRIPGQFTVSFTGKWLTSLDNSSTPFAVVCQYTDGTTGLWVPLTSETSVCVGTTPADKTVEKFSVTFGGFGTFEIKDLMINLGDKPLPYEPYSYSEKAIPSAITSKEAYGDGGNVVDFDELKYSRTRGRKVFTGADSEGWEQGGGTTAPYMYIINISDKYEGPCAESNYFRFAGEADEINNPEQGTYTEWYGDKDIGYYSDISSVEEWKAYLATLNAAGAPLTVVYDLENPEEISLSEASDINPITIASGGMVIFENPENLDMPNTIEYVKRVKEADV